jgi:hypothetical protein
MLKIMKDEAWSERSLLSLVHVFGSGFLERYSFRPGPENAPFYSRDSSDPSSKKRGI